MDPDVPVYVAVSAVDNVGNESAMTQAQWVTPKKLVDDDSIRDELGTIDDKIADAKQAAIDESVVTAGGVTVHNKTTTPVDSSSDKEHDVWQQWTTLEEGGTLVRQHGCMTAPNGLSAASSRSTCPAFIIGRGYVRHAVGRSP